MFIFSYGQNWLNGLWDESPLSYITKLKGKTTQLQLQFMKKLEIKETPIPVFFAVFGIKETLNPIKP
jgi:hypothetical protein